MFGRSDHALSMQIFQAVPANRVSIKMKERLSMNLVRSMKRLSLAMLFVLLLIICVPIQAADLFEPIDFRQVRLGGEMGRRIDITINQNLLQLNVDRDFLAPFQKREGAPSYIGLGKLIDATVRLAASGQDARLLAMKRHLIDAACKTQEADGYIGLFPPAQRLFTLWDIHEMSYLVLALTADYQFFGEKKCLAERIKRSADRLNLIIRIG